MDVPVQSLVGTLHEGERPAAVAVMSGLALSILPILLRALPHLMRHAGSDPAVTIIGLVGYIAVTTVTVIVMIARWPRR